MRLIEWLKPGIRIKRWILLGLVGIAAIAFGLAFLVKEIYYNLYMAVLSFVLILSGCVFIYLSVKYLISTFFNAINDSKPNFSLSSDKLAGLMLEKRILIKGPKIVAIGGGTGLSTMLRGLKMYSSNITAIVTVADDGGGSGVLRSDLGMLPPGDIRNCILALADTEPIMEKLLQYRFPDGMLKGQSFGNLFLAAMDGISSNFEEAVRKMSDVLAVTGRVLPVTLDDIKLNACLEDGTVMEGESQIGKRKPGAGSRIKRVFLKPADVKPLPEVIDAIREADVIILGPGSLYTSIIPNLLVEGVCDAIKESNAVKVYVCNIMTQPGETDGYTLSEHIRAIEQHTCKGIIQHCVANTSEISWELKKKYMEDGAEMVKLDFNEVIREGIHIVGGDILSVNNSLIRHDARKLAGKVVELVAESVLASDKKRIVEYYYVKDRLRKLVG